MVTVCFADPAGAQQPQQRHASVEHRLMSFPGLCTHAVNALEQTSFSLGHLLGSSSPVCHQCSVSIAISEGLRCCRAVIGNCLASCNQIKCLQE